MSNRNTSASVTSSKAAANALLVQGLFRLHTGDRRGEQMRYRLHKLQVVIGELTKLAGVYADGAERLLVLVQRHAQGGADAEVAEKAVGKTRFAAQVGGGDGIGRG